MMFDILLEAALRATGIAVVAAGVLWTLRVRAAAVRHRVWTVVMVAMLALPLAIAWAPEVPLRVMPSSHPQESSVGTPAPHSVSVAATPVEPATSTQSTRVVLTPAPPWNWRAWLIAVYFAGAGLLLARLVVGAVRVRLLARDAELVNGVLTSAGIATPFTFGALAPRILLPQGWDRWSAPQLAAVLEHERAHVQRRDPLVQWLALLNRAVFWFHPLAWWLERRLAALAEEACDAAVLARGHSPADYAEQLLELARLAIGRRTPSPAAMPMPGSNLATRIAKILDGGTTGQAGSRPAAICAAALATLAAAVLGTVTLAQETTAPRTLAQETTAPRTVTQEAVAPRAVGLETTAPRNLLDVYELALVRDAAVREAEAEYRALTAARPQDPSAIARAMAEHDAARQALLIRVADSYFDVFAAQSTLAAQEAAREALARQREQTERRFEVGLIGITDVMEIRAAADRAAANALTAQRELAEAQAVLREVVGEPVGELRPIAEDLPLTMPEPSNAEAWIEAAMERNPTLAATRLRAESAGDAEARDDLERLARRTEAETRAAYLGVVSEISRGRALEQSVRSNQSAVKATRAGFEAGTRTTVDVLTAQSILREAETAYAHSRYDYALNVLRLRGAAGALTTEELADTKAWFE